jgi:hypothetical protein
MDKKGSHVGIVISFVIFITFLVFLYSALQPSIKIGRNKESTLDYLTDKLIEKLSSNLTRASININEEVPLSECIELMGFIEETKMNPPHIIVINEEGESYPSYLSDDGENLYIIREDSSFSFFKIYNSSEFDPTTKDQVTNCKDLDKELPENYEIGSLNSQVYIFEKRIIDLKEKYETEEGYEELKEELKLYSDDFGFSFTYSDGTKTETEQKDLDIEIHAKELTLQYVNEETNILQGRLNVWVW